MFASVRLLRCMVLAMVFCVMSLSASLAQTRSLKLYYLHTGEKATISYKRNGKYIQSGLTKINRFLRDWRRNEPTKMDPKLLDLVWEVYKESGSKEYIHVISGYRSPATNKLLRKRGRGVASKSQHVLGKALDFFMPDVKLSKLRRIGLIQQRGGVGYYPKSGSPFVHIDTGRVRHWPRMSPRELARVFPNGKTLHVSTNGKPLPGYDLAKASYERKLARENKTTVAVAEKTSKKPNLFERLLGAGADRDEDKAANTTPLPKPVQTTVHPPTSKPAAPTPVAPVPTPPVPDASQVAFAQLANPAIPTSAPRPAEPDAPVEIAAIDPSLSEPVAYQPEPAVPVPLRRPEYAAPADEIQIAENSEAVPVELPAPEPEIVVTALTPGEIEDLRRQINVDNAAEVKLAGLDPIEPGAATGEIAIPGISPARPKPVKEPVLIAALVPVDPDHTITLGFALPTPNPARLATARVSEPVPVDEEPGGILLASIPVPEQNPLRVEQIAAEIVVAALPVDAGALAPRTISLEEFSMPDITTGLIGKWALVTNTTIAGIADIRLPAYGRNAIRQLPSTVLTRGFARDYTSHTSNRFTGSSVEFLAFAKFGG